MLGLSEDQPLHGPALSLWSRRWMVPGYHGDYCQLNNVTVPDRYPLQNSADSAGISGSKLFTKLNIQKGYYLVPMAPDDIKKTGIITPFGMF